MMKRTVLLVLAAAGCRAYPEREPAALIVRTEPPGAAVRVGKLEQEWVTPCEIAHPSIRRGRVEIALSLDGHEPQVHQVSYDGRSACRVEVKLAPRAAPAQVLAQGGGNLVRVSAGGRVVAEVPTRDVKVRVELLDAETGTVRRSVDLAPEVVPPPPGAARVGQVQLVHRVFGVFVRLDAGLSVAPGEEVVIVREGREVARTKVLQVTSADGRYPDGAAQAPADGAGIRKGDEVRRAK
jgi:hypothetical protein